MHNKKRITVRLRIAMWELQYENDNMRVIIWEIKKWEIKFENYIQEIQNENYEITSIWDFQYRITR